jgi:hypothetical protein
MKGTKDNIFLCDPIPKELLGKLKIEEMFPLRTPEITAYCRVLYYQEGEKLFLCDFYDHPYYTDEFLKDLVKCRFLLNDEDFISEFWDRIELSKYPESEKTSIYCGAIEVARAKKLALSIGDK